jgi:hypothetical protein
VWVRGNQSFDYEVVDNVGVKGASAVVAGAVRGNDPRGCNYAQRIPCPSAPGTLEVDTADSPEGSQLLTVIAEDAAGNRAESAAVRCGSTMPRLVR